MPIHRLDTPHALTEAVARHWADDAAAAVRLRGRFRVALAGGRTPRGAYTRLRRDPYAHALPWADTEIYFGDERCVPPDHADSNFRMARESLLDHVPIPADQVFPMRATADRIRQDAADYAMLLRHKLPAANAMPCFDLVLLGLGPDGHVASLFPNTCILHESTTPVAAVYVDQLHTWRMSITFPVLAAAREIAVLVAGTGKAEIVHRILAGPAGSAPLPAHRLLGQSNVHWYLDRAAAARLPEAP